MRLVCIFQCGVQRCGSRVRDSLSSMSSRPFDLVAAASAEMLRENFHPQPTKEGIAQLAQVIAEAHGAECSPGTDCAPPDPSLRDTRDLLWSSIDNDTSRDLDQIEVATENSEGNITVMVGVADVSATVAKNTPLDQYAAYQTQTVYTAVHNFSMLPIELSTGITSLNENQDRAAVIVQFTLDSDGNVTQQTIFQALVRNHAQLAYSKIGAWLEKTAPADPKVAALPDLQAQLQLQDKAAQLLHAHRVKAGALEFNRMEADPVVIDGVVKAINTAHHNRATDLIEDFMIAANGVMARMLKDAKRSCIRRVVRSPQRWDRIVALVDQYGTKLPEAPDSAALNDFLQTQRAADPVRYPDLSLAIIKLMGRGEYVLSKGDDDSDQSHFGLAAHDYTHSTAPNRRFADLVTQRVVKAMLQNQPPPYTDDELSAIAQHCTQMEANAAKVERTMQKRIAAVALAGSVGNTFHGVITGAGDKGVFVRVFDPPVEGMVTRGGKGLDVGDKVDVTLLHTDPQHAFIDFGKN